MIFSNFSFKTYSKLANATKIEPNLNVNHTDDWKIRKIIEHLQKQQKYPYIENFAGFKILLVTASLAEGQRQWAGASHINQY